MNQDHPLLEHYGMPTGWVIILAGNLVGWLGENAFQVFGAACMGFGCWVQWRTYKLRERVAAEGKKP